MKIYGWREGCEFCCHDDKQHKEQDGFNFYAGYSKQIDVDAFCEDEINDDEINYCPVCGRKIEG